MMEEKKIDKYNVGDSSSLEVIATEDLFNQIAELSGDKNPIHIDEEYAEKTIFKGRIAHGLFCLGMVSNVIAKDLPGEGAILLEETIQYVQPVYIGDKIKCICVIEGKDRNKNKLRIGIKCINQDMHIVLSGNVIVRV